MNDAKTIVKLNKDWNWNTETDRYLYHNGVLEVTGWVVGKELDVLGREDVYQAHVLSILEKILAEWKASR